MQLFSYFLRPSGGERASALGGMAANTVPHIETEAGIARAHSHATAGTNGFVLNLNGYLHTLQVQKRIRFSHVGWWFRMSLKHRKQLPR